MNNSDQYYDNVGNTEEIPTICMDKASQEFVLINKNFGHFPIIRNSILAPSFAESRSGESRICRLHARAGE